MKTKSNIIQKRMFNKGIKPIRKSISYTEEMYKALQQLTKATGQTVPELAVDLIDASLIDMVDSGEIDPPKSNN